MAAFMNDSILDAALDYIDTNATDLHICSQQPTTRTEAVTTYSLGNKPGITVSAPTDGDTTGRKVVVSAITDGSVTATDTATHYAIVSGTELLVAQALSSSQAVTSGNTFTTTELDITIPDPTA